MSDNQMLLQSVGDNTLWIVGALILIGALFLLYKDKKSSSKVKVRPNHKTKTVIRTRTKEATSVLIDEYGNEIGDKVEFTMSKEHIKETLSRFKVASRGTVIIIE